MMLLYNVAINVLLYSFTSNIVFLLHPSGRKSVIREIYWFGRGDSTLHIHMHVGGHSMLMVGR